MAALSAMTRPRQPTLRLLSLNVLSTASRTATRGAGSSFNLLDRDKPAFWCHYQFRGVAILFRTGARTLNFTVRHRSATGRTLSVDFTFGGLPYTAVCVYASSVAAERPHYLTQELLPSTRADHHLLVGGDFNCIAGQQDVLDPASLPGQRTLGYWTGLCHVETDHMSGVTSTPTGGRFPTSPRQANQLPAWTRGSYRSKEPQATGHCNRLPIAAAAREMSSALQRSWALAAQHRASPRVLEADGRVAMAAYSRERQIRTELKALRTGVASDTRVVLDTPAGRDQGGAVLRDYHSGYSATGLFAAHLVSEAAQVELLQAVDMFLPPEAAATAEGANGDGSMPAAELEAALRSLTRGKAPGMDGIPYEFYQRFWLALSQELTDVLHEAFITEASPALPPSLLQGRITLLYKGKGADRESPAGYRPITLLNTLASRLGPVLNPVVNATQTGFFPERWAGEVS
ncbi:g11733 [Coccomyxa elongata]